ncbi:MAG: transposase [Sphingomonadaceae bacterium]
MPHLIDCIDTGVADVAETVSALGEEGFNPADESSLSGAALALRRLGNNREFLGDMLVDGLRERQREIGEVNAYGAQAIMLARLPGGHFIRANIWPSEHDACFQASGARSFVYGLPHDHNFSFLTLGYFGPGYESDYYEYDHAATIGYRGERAGLRFIERSALSEGKMMLYRAHVDVHAQLPARSMSVSLNIVRSDPAEAWIDQYGFDLATGAITGVLNSTSTETFLRCAVGLGGDEALDLAEHFGRHHPCDRLRLASFEARAMLLDKAARDELWRRAERSGSRLVAAEARLKRSKADCLA